MSRGPSLCLLQVKEYTTGMYKSRFKLKKLAKDKNIVPHVFMVRSLVAVCQQGLLQQEGELVQFENSYD